MTDYSQLSDFEINKRVWIETGLAKSSEPLLKSVFTSQGKIFNPCNSWADAGPIIVESRIMINPYCADEMWKSEVQVSHDGFMTTYATAYDKNPLRVAMIVYLMMREANGENVVSS